MDCDTLLLLGCDFAWRQFYPNKATIIQIDVDGTHLGRRHPVDIAAVGDVGPTIDALLPRLNARTDHRFLDEALKHARDARAELEKHAVVGGRGVIHPQYLAELISRHAAPDAVYTADGGSPMVWCLRHVTSTGANRTIVSLSHGTMANAMPQALGAQGGLSRPAGYRHVRRRRTGDAVGRSADHHSGVRCRSRWWSSTTAPSDLSSWSRRSKASWTPIPT